MAQDPAPPPGFVPEESYSPAPPPGFVLEGSEEHQAKLARDANVAERLRRAAIPQELGGGTEEQKRASRLEEQSHYQAQYEPGDAPIPAFSEPVEHAAQQAIPQAAAGIANKSGEDIAAGTAGVLKDAISAATPLLGPIGITAAPAKFLAGLAGSVVGEKLAGSAAKAVNAAPGYQEAAEVGGGVLGAVAGAGSVDPLAKKLFPPGSRFNPLNPEVGAPFRSDTGHQVEEPPPPPPQTIDLAPNEAGEYGEPPPPPGFVAEKPAPTSAPKTARAKKPAAPSAQQDLREQPEGAAPPPAAAQESPPPPPGFVPEDEGKPSEATNQSVEKNPATRGPVVYGRSTTIPVPNSDTHYEARYVLREAEDVHPSHSGTTFEANPEYEHENDRDYKRNADLQGKVIERAKPSKFDPEKIINDANSAVVGPSIWDERGNTLGGNNRDMILDRVKEYNPEGVEKYKAMLVAKAPQFGFTPEQVMSMKDPRIGREVAGVKNPQDAITDFNKEEATALTPAEQAIADSRRMTPELLDHFASKIADEGEDASLASTLDGPAGPDLIERLIKEGIIPAGDRNKVLTKDNVVTAEAKLRVGRLMVGRFFDTPAELDDAAPSLRQKLERVVAPVAQTAGGDFDIMPRVKGAIAVLTQARQRGIKNLDLLEKQEGMFGDVLDPKDIALARVLQASPLAAAKQFRQYASDAALTANGQSVFFEPPTPEQAFNDAFGTPPPRQGTKVKKPDGSAPPEEDESLKAMVHVPKNPEPSPFKPEDSAEKHAANIKHLPVKLSPEDAKLADAYVANTSTVASWIRAISENKSAAKAPHVSGFQVKPTQANIIRAVALRDSLRNASPAAHEGAKQIVKILTKANTTGKSVVILHDAPGFTQQWHAETLAHEMAHAVQASVIDQTANAALTGTPLVRFMGSPLALKAAESLRKAYPFAETGEMSDEIGARLMARTDQEQMGLSNEQMRSLGAAYVRALREEHGNAKPAEIAKRVFETLRRPKPVPSTAGAIQPNESTGSVRQAGERGPPASTHGALPGGSGLQPRDPYQSDLFGQTPQLAQAGESYKNQITGARLTAQLNAPLTRAEQLQKLKPVAPRGHSSLFGGDAPDTPQGMLFMAHQPSLENLQEYLRKTLTGKEKDEPKANYSGLGAVENAYVRNLSQLGRASENAHAAVVKAATSRAQVNAMMRVKVPLIKKALAGSGVSWDEFRQGLTQSRLEGIRERWQGLSRQAANATDTGLHKAFENGMADLLKKIQGRSGMPDNLDQATASMLETAPSLLKPRGPDYAGLRKFLTQTFTDAADRVNDVMDAKRFAEISKLPQVKQAIGVYDQNLSNVMRENHAQNEGVFSNALGPWGTYYPLVPTTQPYAISSGRRQPYVPPKNPGNYFATGLSAGYDTGAEALNDHLQRSIRANDRAGALKALEEAGLIQQIQKAPPRGQPFTYLYKGQEYEGALVGPNILAPRWLQQELEPILEPKFQALGLKERLNKIANTIAISGTVDAVFHSANILGALDANTPFLGPTMMDKLGAAPLVKHFAIIQKILATDPSTPEALKDIQQMAREGTLPNKYASETFSKKYAEEHGVELNRHSLGPALYGPKGIDIRARLIMHRLAKHILPNGGTPLERYKFVNQLGNYNSGLQSKFERALKSTGFGPFATAGTTMTRGGINAVLGTQPVPKGTKGRYFYWLRNGLGFIATWAAIHYLYTGKNPMTDPKAKLGMIPLRPDHRSSWLGRALFGNDLKKTGYLSMGAFSPLPLRGLRALGLTGLFEAHALKGNSAQMMDAMVKDVVNSFMSPALGPLIRAAFVGVTGNEPHLTGLRNDRGNFSPQFYPAVPKAKSTLGSEGAKAIAAVGELNGLYKRLGIAAGFLPDNEGAKGGNPLIRQAVDTVAPGLVGGASNQSAKGQFMKQQRGQRR